MLLKLVAIDVDTGNFVFQEVSEGLPAGTENQIIRNDGTDWVTADYTTLTDDSNSVEFRMENGTFPDGKYTKFKLTDTFNSFEMSLDTALPLGSPRINLGVSSSAQTMYFINNANQFIYIYTNDTQKGIGLSSINGDIVYLRSNVTASDSNKILEMQNTLGDYFVVYGDGKIFSKSLTANSLLQANDNKEIISIPKVVVTDDGTNRTIKLLDNSNAEKLLISSGVEPKIVIQNGADSYIDFVGGLSNPVFRLQTSTLKFRIGSGSLPITLVKNNVSVFNVSDAGLIKSNTLTANTYLGANANKEIVSIPSPNTITNLAEDFPVAVGSGWQPLPNLNFMLEPNVTYELDFLIAIYGAQGRSFKLKLDTATATYTFRPFVINTAGVATDILYAVDGTYGIPQTMDNEAEITLMTGNTYHFAHLKGILKTTNNIANAQYQIYNDSGFTITVKAYSYLKLSR